MDIRLFVMQFFCILLSAKNAGSKSIYEKQHFCGKNVSIILKKYGCVYVSGNKSTTHDNNSKGIATDCCLSSCSIQFMVNTYCEQSNITLYEKTEPPIDNEIRREKKEDNFITNAIIREHSRDDQFDVARINKQTTTYPPAVVGVKRERGNIPIPVRTHR